MKLLFISNVGYRFNSFASASSAAANDQGIEFHIASNWSGYDDDKIKYEDEEKYGVIIHQIDFVRTPYDPGNIKAYRQVVNLIKQEKFDIIHCNTPIGGVVGRLAGHRCRVRKVIYQAHGFHFYKGAPFVNWILYYPIERWLAHYTDILITINQEDYARARSFKLRDHGKVFHVPGVGIDTSNYVTKDVVRENKRNELNLKSTDIAVISMGDLIERKNYRISIEAIARTNDPNIHYFICGQGRQEEELRSLVKKLAMERQIHFLGYRTDIKELLQGADIFLFTTLQEGLPRSMMEAMASGLPCIASKVRGNTDLLKEGENGYLISPNDVEGFAAAIISLAGDDKARKEIGINNIKRMIDFSFDTAETALFNIYKTVLGGG